MDTQIFVKKADAAVAHLEKEFMKIQLGTASAGMLEWVDVYVPAYDMTQKISALGNVTVLDAQSLKVEAWDKTVLPSIEKAIYDANMWLQPVNHGEHVLVTVPPVTTERRQQIAKHVAGLGEDAKVSVRSARHERQKTIKQQFEDKDISEDQKFTDEKELDDLVKKYNDTIETLVQSKSDDVLSM